jgi:ribosomal protein S18 acetylase RimI-like enzyme
VHTIRHTSTADIPLIRELTFNVWPQTYRDILTSEQIDYMLEMMYSPSSLEKQMQEGCSFIIVYDNDNPVGFASYQLLNDNIAKLHKIYVLPSQQGKGTGKFLLDYIIVQVKEQGAASLQLQVNRDNTAKDFYEKKGFTVIKEADFDIGNGYYMNDYVMEKKL